MRAGPAQRGNAPRGGSRAEPQRRAAPATRELENAIAGTGMPLSAGTRAFMEPRFGHDFGSVRIHADAAAHSAARALGAAAFTLGGDVYFGADRPAPDHPATRHILAHELAHVVQQRSAGSAGRPDPDIAAGAGAALVNHPTDAFERAAGRAAAAALAPAPPGLAGRAAAVPGGAAPPTIQRFLAGEDGHGGVEEKALVDAGLSHEEYREAYYGNWLRDFSQQMPGKFEIARVLARGEFGEVPSDQDYGRYLPSEHVDRPDGSDSPEDPRLLAKAANDPKAQAKLADDYKHLSPEQKQWVDGEKAMQSDVRKASDRTGLPDYIELGKEHVRHKLADAATAGRSPRGLLAMGNGLHAVEDYFAHSNFVEVALSIMLPHGPGLDALLHRPGLDPVQGQGLDNHQRPQIFTGTSAPGASDGVGRQEVIKTELQNHEILKYMALGFLKNPWAAGRMLSFGPERTVLGALFGAVSAPVGAALGSVTGLLAGAAGGAARGWKSGHGFWSKLGRGIGGLFTGAGEGLVHGFLRGGRAGWGAGQVAGGVAAQALGVPALLALIGLVGAVEATPVVASLLQAFNRWRMRADTDDTIKEDASLTPTHSQIAKDDPEHPLHNLAARLAYVADLGIARSMVQVWHHDKQVDKAQELVDVYMAHPAEGNWWQGPLMNVVTGDQAKGLKPSRSNLGKPAGGP